jgi:hypothetical protein
MPGTPSRSLATSSPAQDRCARNVRSQRAIERLGAVKEAVLRKQMITRGGYVRDSFVYSILDTEWRAVKTRLEGFLNREYA